LVPPLCGSYTHCFMPQTLADTFRPAKKPQFVPARGIANLPPMGFIDTLSMIAVTLLCSVLGALVSGVLMFVLVAYGIPALLSL